MAAVCDQRRLRLISLVIYRQPWKTALVGAKTVDGQELVAYPPVGGLREIWQSQPDDLGGLRNPQHAGARAPVGSEQHGIHL